jgi:hypothetical protein
VLGEFNTSNNQLNGGEIQIRKMGDVDGDGIVNIRDVTAAILAFYTWPSKPRWNPYCDLDLNGMVNMRDIQTIAMNFNRS